MTKKRSKQVLAAAVGVVVGLCLIAALISFYFALAAWDLEIAMGNPAKDSIIIVGYGVFALVVGAWLYREGRKIR